MDEGHHRDDGSETLRARLWFPAVCLLVASCGSHGPVIKPSPTPEAPTLTCPEDIATVAHFGQPPPTASFDLPAAHDGQPPVMVVCTPPTESEFPNGENIVTCEATDGLQRKATCSFAVRVTTIPRLARTTFLAFGDSLTEGTVSLRAQGVVTIPQRNPPVSSSSASYVQQLSDKLGARYQDQTTTIIADGFGGRKADDDEEHQRLREQLVQWKPDALLLLEGTNDLLNFPNATGINDAAGGLQRMVSDAKNQNVRVFLATLPRMNAHASRPKQGVSAAESVVPMLNDRIRQIASAQNVKLVDMYAAIPLSEIGDDGVHLHPAGYTLMADEWLKAIAETMELSPPSLR